MEIKDKVVIVTGASSGIGEATAKLLAENGAKVALVARTKEKLETLAQQLKSAIPIQADLRDEEEIAYMVHQTFEQYGKIDVLINNAGRGYHVPITEVESQKFRALFDLNVLGPLLAMQHVIPIMKKQGHGVIVNISSGTALGYTPGLGVYSASKRALGGISLTAREELKKDNIAVCLVYPFITKTEFHNNLLNESRWDFSPNPNLPAFDTPEYVAEKILEAITTEAAEVFVHDWMDPTQK